MTRVAVILCGAGRFDGSEIHESVLSLLHLERHGADWMAFAPDRPQWAVCKHFAGEVDAGAERNQLQEAARITRGRVQPLEQARAEDFDALILPGGSGAARNLCDFAERGGEAEVDPVLARLIVAFHAAGKPIGAICIAPALVALVLGKSAPQITLGPIDDGPSVEAARTGARMVDCAVEEIHVDHENRIVSTPAYILGPDLVSVDLGIGRLISEVLQMAALTVAKG